ncbi:MAG: type II secretion system minor pseudopilin GspK [Saccharospirillum sp.]
MSRESGFALIQVLLVFAILAVVVSRLQYEQRIQVERAYQSLFISQSQSYIDSAEAIARVGLTLDLEQTQTDHFYQDWNQPIGPLPLEEGLISLELNDLQGRFNLNWLHPESGFRDGARDGLKRLLIELGLDSALADELYNWFDEDSGAEFNYGDQVPGYTPSFQPMADVSELRLLKSADNAVLDTLRPYISALPADSALNINTAAPEVLMTLASFIGLDDARGFVDDRGEAGYDSVEALTGQPLFQEAEAPMLIDNLDIRSYWFDLFTEVQVGERNLTQHSRLFRDTLEGVLVTQRSQAQATPNRAAGDPINNEDDANANPTGGV